VEKLPFGPYDFFGYLASGYLVLIASSVLFGIPPVLGRDLKVVESLALALGAYVVGQMVATPAKALLEDGIVGKILGRPSVNLFRAAPPRLRKLLFPGYYVALPRAARNAALDKAKLDGITEPGEDLFLLVRFGPATLGNANLMTRLGTFINLYGFSRNLCFSAIVTGLALLAASWFLGDPDGKLWKYGVGALVGGVFLFYRYLKFYRQYSYELFNTYGRSK
jgi:hypothetical protein